MADFLVEFQGFEADKESDAVVTDPIEWWHIHTDDSSNVVGSEIGMVLVAHFGLVFELSAKLEGKMTNNEAEYETIFHGFDLAKQVDARFIRTFVDSAIIAGPISEVMNVNEPHLKLYLDKVKILLQFFEGFTITRIPREHNQDIDRMTKIESYDDR